jgi:hypothetical protein
MLSYPLRIELSPTIGHISQHSKKRVTPIQTTTATPYNYGHRTGRPAFLWCRGGREAIVLTARESPVGAWSLQRRRSPSFPTLIPWVLPKL